MTHPSKKTDQIASKLIAYLKDKLNDSTIEYDSPLTPLHGGFETAIYRFQLKGIQKELNKRLVLRLYPEYYSPKNAVWESSIQNALVKEGYPAAKAHFICIDKSILGGAFFVMDFLGGKALITAPLETIPRMLGEAHAALHKIDPGTLIESLNEQGIDDSQCSLDNRFDSLYNIAKELPWISDGVDWLMENRPSEPGRLAVCHGDFHPLNILIQDGTVTGVLDWPGFLITDPALDIANTIFLTTVAFKHLSSTILEPEHVPIDCELISRLYLDAYRAQFLFDGTNLDYYKTRRSIHALLEGFQGHQVWRHPSIVKDLIECIYKDTGIRITMPD